ncbi:MAG: DUF2318 domain-containing protein [Nitrospirae bacterium]|nr:DUF2318 domain-containing protein [Nitrospirota bacterium]
MSQPFLIAFREASQTSLLVMLILFSIRSDRGARALLAGVISAATAGFITGYLPYFSEHLPGNEKWLFWRYVSETVLFYLSIFFVLARPEPAESAFRLGMFILGFLLCFFEARGTGFLIHDMGLMEGNVKSYLAAGIAGIISGVIPFAALRRILKKIPFQEAFTFPSLLMTIGAVKFAFGGVGELEKGNILVELQKGLLAFLEHAVRFCQSLILLSSHAFIKVPFSGLADFIAGDRTAMTISVFFIMVPPLFILIHLFARPDPLVETIQSGAQKRLSVAFFRKELVYRTFPVLAAFILLVVLLHQVNISMNPFYEPVPITVREEGDDKIIRIPMSDRLSDFSDGKVKKYVYYYGNKQIIFLAILKQDGSMGVALDECEICRPAEWNKDAQGYAQRGNNLVCKYCMTPIAIPTINNPGGCNPIPVPFRLDEGNIVIGLEDLIRIYKNTQELEKKGTHF